MSFLLGLMAQLPSRHDDDEQQILDFVLQAGINPVVPLVPSHGARAHIVVQHNKRRLQGPTGTSEADGRVQLLSAHVDTKQIH